MNDIRIAIFLIVLGLIIFSIEFIFSCFSYEVCNNMIIMKWRILRYVPLGIKKVKFEDIKEIRGFKLKDDFGGGYIFGNLFTKQIIVIVLKRGLFRKVFITPDEPDIFLNQVNKAIS